MKAFIIILTFLLSGCVFASTPEDPRDSLLDILIGSYMGEMENEPGVLTPISHSFERVDAPHFGEFVLLYQVINGDKDTLGSQAKIFVLTNDAERNAIRTKVYLLSFDDVPTTGAANEWVKIDPESLRGFPEDCDIFWTEIEGGFTGNVKPSDCTFPSQVFKGNIRPKMTYQVFDDSLLWEEALYRDNMKVIVSTDGLLSASRQSGLE